jgi:hypothetical protein
MVETLTTEDRMIIEAKDEVTAAVDALMALASQYERGQCISWGEVEAIVGIRDNDRAKYVIGKWRRKLENEREILTLTAVTVGVRLLTHKEAAAEIPALRLKRAYRQTNRMIKQTRLVDVTRLSDHERKVLVSQRANAVSIRRDLFRSRKQLTTSTPTEGNPRRRAIA